MRYLVLSDLHSNLEALEAALAEGRELGYDWVLVLGDLVGYGPDPNGVLDALRGMDNATIIRGNHDRVAAGLSEVHGSFFHRDRDVWISQRRNLEPQIDGQISLPICE